MLLIQERELLTLQQSVGEVNEIFRDLGTLVNQQQYLIDNIETNVENVVANSQAANEELGTASKSQTRTSSWLCWIFLILLVVVGVILLVYIMFK